MDKIPKVSVLMPVYNCRAFIEESISSILNQTFTDFEFLIIDDCSTDGTYEFLQKLTDPRIKLIAKTKNSGITTSLNMGLDLAKGEYIARMDGDDCSLPHRFQRQVDLLDHDRDIVLCGSWIGFINDDRVKQYPSGPDEIEQTLFRQNPIAHPSVMYRQSVITDHALKYDRSMEPSEDYDLWMRMSLYGKIRNIPEVLLNYRDHNNQVSKLRSKEQKNKNIKIRSRILDRLYSGSSSFNINENIDFNSRNTEDNKKKFLLFENEIENLQKLNREKNIFKIRIFENHLEIVRTIVIRKFFLYQSSFNWSILPLFLFNGEQYYKYFNRTEKLKVILKCLMFKKTI
jgi:glycosyltransferase involved in cell wall biosynthesis